MSQFVRSALAAVSWMVVTVAAQATVIDFETPIDSPYAESAPLLGSGDEFYQGNFWLDTWSTKSGAEAGDLVGAIVDGADLADTCMSVDCPTNDTSHFFTALNDGYLALGTLDSSPFYAQQLDASFVAASGDAVLSTSLLLRVVGYVGTTLSFVQDIYLPGPTNGVYSFATYSLSAVNAAKGVTELDIYGYACVTTNTCTRSLDKAQFALDNIILAAPVPEPSEWALMALGLGALGMARRRANRS